MTSVIFHYCRQYCSGMRIKWYMVAFGHYTCTLEMNKVHNFFIFFFSFAVTRSGQYQGCTLLYVWCSPHHHTVSDWVSSQSVKLHIFSGHAFHSFGVFAHLSDLLHHMYKQLTVPYLVCYACVRSDGCGPFSVSPLLLALTY